MSTRKKQGRHRLVVEVLPYMAKTVDASYNLAAHIQAAVSNYVRDLGTTTTTYRAEGQRIEDMGVSAVGSTPLHRYLVTFRAVRN